MSNFNFPEKLVVDFDGFRFVPEQFTVNPSQPAFWRTS